jgi:hypothetical protein
MVKRTKTGRKRAPAQSSPNDIIDSDEIAALLGVSRRMVGKLFTEHGLPGRLVAGRYLSTRGAIVRWLVGSNGNGGNGNGDHASDADRFEEAVKRGDKKRQMELLQKIPVKAGRP